jgi:hypothetical protein
MAQWAVVRKLRPDQDLPGIWHRIMADGGKLKIEYGAYWAVSWERDPTPLSRLLTYGPFQANVFDAAHVFAKTLLSGARTKAAIL